MSDPVMASSSTSTYSNSIKFYEQMSHLQGELKTFESQHFNLEEEFQRLWTQGTSVPFSNGGGEPKNTTLLAQLGHLSEKSQLLANPTNTNLPNYGDQGCRRARNTAILDKLQELETNASIFAARSERLKMMRNEYENLVRKYSTNRNRGQTAGNSRNTDHRKTEHPIKLTSTSVNTDISGAVIAVSSSILPTHPGKPGSLNIDIPPEETQVTFPASTTNSRRSISEQLSPRQDGHGLIAISDRYPNFNPNLLQSTSQTSFLRQDPFVENIPIRQKLPIFSDISSTTTTATESGDWDSKLREQQQHQHPRNYQTQDQSQPPEAEVEAEYEEDDTTSLSGVLSKHQGSNYIQNISTDGTLSESTSANQLQRLPINKRIPRMGDGGGDNIGTTHPLRGERTLATTNTNGGEGRTAANSMGKTFMISSASVDERVKDSIRPYPEVMMSYPNPTKEEDNFDHDDSMASVGDSVMDSICNKIPDSLPRDDSELLHIAEVDEEGDAVRDWEDGAKRLPANEVLQTTLAALPNRDGEDQPEPQEGIQTQPTLGRIYSPPPKRIVAVATKEENQGVYEIPEQDQDGNREFINGRNKGVAINGDELGGVGKEIVEKGPPPEKSGPKEKSQVRGEANAQGSHVKLNMKNDKRGKPSSRKKLKMDYDDSESDEVSEKGRKDADQNSAVLTALKQNKVPTKEELDAEFEDFFG